MSDNSISDVALLFPQGKEVTIGSETFTIKPFGFGKLPKVLNILNAIKVASGEADKVKLADMGGLDILQLIANNASLVVDVCALAINKPASYFEDMDVDKGVELVQTIIEVNGDFFVKRLQPKLMGAIEGLLQSVGAMLSQASSPTVTS